MVNRRGFLRSCSVLALAPTAPGFIARTARGAAPRADGRVLVVVQLDGGNDSLNTVVPFADPEYEKLRPRLRQDRRELVKLNDSLGLHPALRPLGKLWEAGHLAVIPGIGYPNPTRSHFGSMAVWHTGLADEKDRVESERDRTGYGWLGRALDASGGESCVVNDDVPQAVWSRRAAAVSLAGAEDLLLADPTSAKATAGTPTAGDDLLSYVRRQTIDAISAADKLGALPRDQAATTYPETTLGHKLWLVSRMLRAGAAARVFYAVQDGYDTHESQDAQHADLLAELAGAVAAFFADLKGARLAERVALLAFSEFGRTVRENGSAGTDHGTAGCVFVAGPEVKGGVRGTMPSLTDLEKGEPKMTTDFRGVYASLLETWLGIPARGVLGGRFEPVQLFRG
jgi:uncharacterized protein (DUF1501 family)